MIVLLSNLCRNITYLADGFVELIDLLREQAGNAGQDELVSRLVEIKNELTAMLLVAGNK